MKDESPASSLTSPMTVINLALGLVLGFGLGNGLASISKLLDNTDKNEDELQGTPLLASISFGEIADDKQLVSHTF